MSMWTRSSQMFCRDSCKKTPVDCHGKEVILPPKPTKDDYEKIADYREHDGKDRTEGVVGIARNVERGAFEEFFLIRLV
jgi:hypothetical protein